jgi:single-strand DNA-binding protein
MKSVNTVTLLGNVARDPELKKPNDDSKHSVCTFGLATNRVYKDADGVKQTLPEFHSIVAFGRLAEFCADYVQKGNPLFVQGYLKTTSWEGKHGETHYRTEVVLDDITLLGKKKPEEEVAEESIAA